MLTNARSARTQAVLKKREIAKNSQVFPLCYLKMTGFERMVMFLVFFPGKYGARYPLYPIFRYYLNGGLFLCGFFCCFLSLQGFFYIEIDFSSLY